MRYSILGFNQQKVLSLTAIVKNDSADKDIVLSLDVSDLLILNLMADFPNRIKVKKIMKGDKVFFWASYDEILKELPILNIKKHALANRFDKLEKLNLIEREYLTINSKNNLTFFCLTKTYESLLYGEDPYRSQMQDPSCSQMKDPIAVDCNTLSQLTEGPYRSQMQERNNNIVNNNKEKDNITEDKTDTIVSYEGESTLSPKKEESIDWNDFMSYFNSVMADKGIQPISRFTDKRKQSVKARMREYGKRALMEVIQKAATSDFLNGKNNRGWTADFDWLFRPNNFPKVLEGNYENRENKIITSNYVSRDEQRAIEVQRRKEGAANIIARLAAEEQCDNG